MLNQVSKNLPSTVFFKCWSRTRKRSSQSRFFGGSVGGCGLEEVEGEDVHEDPLEGTPEAVPEEDAEEVDVDGPLGGFGGGGCRCLFGLGDDAGGVRGLSRAALSYEASSVVGGLCKPAALYHGLPLSLQAQQQLRTSPDAATVTSGLSKAHCTGLHIRFTRHCLHNGQII